MMLSLPFLSKHSLGPLLVGSTAVILFWFAPGINELLAYDRYALQGWETWRIITGNLLHTNGYHLLLNLAGLALLYLLHAEYYQPLRFVKMFIWCCVGTTLGIYWLSPQLIWYVGLSGALHGMFVWGACLDIRQRMLTGWLLLAGVAVKVVYEQLAGSSASVARLIEANVAIDAHLYGAASGLLLTALMWAGRSWRQRRVAE